MFGALVIGIGIGVIFTNNQHITGFVPTVNNILQEDGSNILQEDGVSVILIE